MAQRYVRRDALSMALMVRTVADVTVVRSVELLVMVGASRRRSSSASVFASLITGSGSPRERSRAARVSSGQSSISQSISPMPAQWALSSISEGSAFAKKTMGR